MWAKNNDDVQIQHKKINPWDRKLHVYSIVLIVLDR